MMKFQFPTRKYEKNYFYENVNKKISNFKTMGRQNVSCPYSDTYLNLLPNYVHI